MSGVSQHYPALVLNTDFRPLSYFPLSLWSWQKAISAVFMRRVNVVDEYETAVHSPSFEMRLPSVISLKDYDNMFFLLDDVYNLSNRQYCSSISKLYAYLIKASF